MTAAPVHAEGQAHRGAARAEREARDRIAPKAGTIRGRLLHMLNDHGDLGLTAWEAHRKYGQQHGGSHGLYSIAPRLSELAFDGYAERSGSYRRPSLAEPRREVYKITPAGREWVRANPTAGDQS